MAQHADHGLVINAPRAVSGAGANAPARGRAATLSLLCVLLAASVAAVNRTVRPLGTAILHPAPLAAFPHALAGWVSGPDVPANTPLLPSATIIERDCRDSQGHEMSLLLLTARDYADFHDPNICLPSQGFTLGPIRRVALGKSGEDAFLMTATRREQKIDVLYWWPGQAHLETGYGYDQWGKLLSLRDRLTGEQGKSLFVRMMAPASPDNEERLTQTAAAWEPALAALRDQGK